MRCQWLVGAAVALSLSVPSPAVAQSALQFENTKSAALRWELTYLALSALDTAQTVKCVRSGFCDEGNPLFGKHPSTKKLVLTKLGGGLAHFALFSYINERNPNAALRLAQVTCAAQGGVVLLNARFAFK